MADANTLTINRNAIQTFATDKPKPLHYRETTQLLLVHASPTAGTVMIDGDIIALSELSTSPDDAINAAWNFSARIAANLNVEHKESDRKIIHLDSNLTLEHNNWRHNLRSQYQKEEENNILKEHIREQDYSLDYFVTNHWLIRGEGFYRENLPNNGMHYKYLGIGPGYRLFGNKKNRLDIISSYDRLWVTNNDIDLTMNAWAITLEYQQYWLSEKLETFAHAQAIYPTEKPIDHVINAEWGARYLITRALYLSLAYNSHRIDYSVGSIDDHSYILSAGINF